MNRNTGRAVTGLEHLRQSVADILTTPVGSRVMRRDYGSLVPELIDQPDNEATQVRLFSAVAGALMRWEPRLQVNRITLSRCDEPGTFLLDLDGQRTAPSGASSTTRLSVPLRFRSP